jgi:DNA-binding NarL/FixJ family response regulator
LTEEGLTRSREATAQLAVVVGPAARASEVVDALFDEGLEVAIADDPDALRELALKRWPSLVVLVGDAPLLSRASTLACVRECAAHAHVVLVCSAVEVWEVRDVLAAGAAGIVLRSELSSTLLPCLRAVRVGQVCVPFRNRRQLERPVLSSREKQILGLVVMGYMNRQIADQLFLAESTVKSHLSSAFGKLEVHSRNEAVDLILDPKHGLDLGILSLGGEPVQQPAGAPA